MSRMGVDIQKAKSPAGFSTRETSGIVACGDAKTVAPWSQNTISNAARRNGRLSASPCTSEMLSRPCTRVGQLLVRQIETYGPRTSLSQSPRPLSRAAAEFEYVTIFDPPKNAQFGFRNTPHAPCHRMLVERWPMRNLIRRANGIPERAISFG